MEKLLRELSILKIMKIKPNYSELARIHKMSRDTIRKYDNGYAGKPKIKPKTSVLDKYKDEIAVKLKIPGTRISSVYQYFLSSDSGIGTESNFRKYVHKHKLDCSNNLLVHPRYETPPGLQMQYDWKENITMVSKHGEIFEFNVLTSLLSNSRKHIFEYSKTKTREDVIKCLTNTFIAIDGVPKICLTDNMSSIVSGGKFTNEFIAFANDFGFKASKCKVRSPETKGKVESKNRFLNWLKPYNNEFETEQDLIAIIKKIEQIANEKKNETTGVAPNLLYLKEKEYLQQLPSDEIINSYLELGISLKVSNESLIQYRKCKYSVPHQYVGKTVKVRLDNNTINIFFGSELIRQHQISKNVINYNNDDYVNIFKDIITDRKEIEDLAAKNLENLDRIGVYE